MGFLKKFFCSFVAGAFIISCGCALASDREVQKGAIATSENSEWLESSFEHFLKKLNLEPRFGAALRPKNDDEGYEAISFLFARAFRGEFLIRLEYYPVRTLSSDDEIDASEPFSVLTIIDRREKQVFDNVTKSVHHTHTSSDIYTRDFDAPVFDRIKDEILRHGIEDMPAVMLPTDCIDGDRYYVALETDDVSKLISRHQCDVDYNSKRIMIQALFEFSQKNAPDAAEYVSAAWDEITNTVPN